MAATREELRTHARMSAGKVILLAALAAGTFDILFAFIYYGLRYGLTPLGILHSIASGIYGPAAYQAGMGVGLFGLFLHYFIMAGATSTYWLAGAKLSLLVRRPVISGIIFGACMYFFMQLVVLPLSNAATAGGNHLGGLPKSWESLLSSLFTHCLLVGVPIALITRRGRSGS
jgi:hypothetical protein